MKTNRSLIICLRARDYPDASRARERGWKGFSTPCSLGSNRHVVAPRQLEAPTVPELRGRRMQTTVYTHKTNRKNVRGARGQAELKAATALYALIMTQLKRRARKLGFVFHNRRALELQGALHGEPEWGRRTIHSPRKVFLERSDRSPRPAPPGSCPVWNVLVTAAATEFSKVKLCVCFLQGGEGESEMQQRWGCPEERDPGESQAKATTILNMSFLIPPASRSARGYLGEPVKGIYHRCAGHGVTQ